MLPVYFYLCFDVKPDLDTSESNFSEVNPPQEMANKAISLQRIIWMDTSKYFGIIMTNAIMEKLPHFVRVQEWRAVFQQSY